MDPILTISRELSLRAVKPHEANILFALIDNNRAHLRAWLPWVDATVNPFDTHKYLEASHAAAEKGASINLGIRNKGELIGVVGFHGFDRLNRVTSLGYWLATEHCGKGIMRAAVSRCVDFAFKEEGMNRLYIRCAVENHRSQRIPQSLGFIYEGTQRQAEWLYTKYVDLQVYSTLASEWRKRAETD